MSAIRLWLATVFLAAGLQVANAKDLDIRGVASIVEAKRVCDLQYDEEKLQTFIEDTAGKNEELSEDLMNLQTWLEIVREEYQKMPKLGRKIFCRRIRGIAKENGFLK